MLGSQDQQYTSRRRKARSPNLQIHQTAIKIFPTFANHPILIQNSVKMFFKTAYEPYESGLSEFIRYSLSLFIVFLGYFLGQIPFMIVVYAQLAERDGAVTGSALEDFASNINFASIGLDANTGFVLLLLSFVVGLLGLWFCLAIIHKRPFKTLITPYKNIRWSKVGFGFGVWFAMIAILEVLSFVISPETYQFQLEWKTWLPLVAIALLIMPMQTSFEELLFRGYLLQGLGLATNSRLVALVITSVLFGGMHLFNPEIQEFGLLLMMPYYIGMGLFLGILTLMDESLELALGIHAANNIFGAVFVTFAGSALQTDAVFRVTEVNTTFMIPVFFLMAGVFIYLCVRKYGWNDWSKIYGPIRSRWVEEEDLRIEDNLVI